MTTHEKSVEAVAKLAFMIDLSAEDSSSPGRLWGHTPEEIGLHVMENHAAIRAAIAAMPAPSDQAKLIGELVEAVSSASRRLFALGDVAGSKQCAKAIARARQIGERS